VTYYLLISLSIQVYSTTERTPLKVKSAAQHWEPTFSTHIGTNPVGFGPTIN
jgi:hypothetical protein